MKVLICIVVGTLWLYGLSVQFSRIPSAPSLWQSAKANSRGFMKAGKILVGIAVWWAAFDMLLASTYPMRALVLLYVTGLWLVLFLIIKIWRSVAG